MCSETKKKEKILFVIIHVFTKKPPFQNVIHFTPNYSIENFFNYFI